MKQKLRTLAVPFAVANLIFLTLHQMDAVYWKEWEMVGIPLNYEVFLFITILLCTPGIFYISRLAKSKRSGYIYSLIWSLFGFIVPIFHSCYFMIQDLRFRAPLSIFLIYIVGIISLPLLLISLDGLQNSVKGKVK